MEYRVPLPDGFVFERHIMEQVSNVAQIVQDIEKGEGHESALRYLAHSGIALKTPDSYPAIDDEPLSIHAALACLHKAHRRVMMFQSMGDQECARFLGDRMGKPTLHEAGRMLGYACILGYASMVRHRDVHKPIDYGIRGTLQISGLAVQRVLAAEAASPEQFAQTQVRCIDASDFALESISQWAEFMATSKRITARNPLPPQEHNPRDEQA